MPTQLEKTAAFLKKIGAETSLLNSNWGGLGDQSTAGPFTQKAPAPSADELASKLNTMSGSADPDQKALAENVQKGVLAKGTDSEAARSAAGGLLGIQKEAPGMVSNYLSALGRGHTGTVAATGAAALLAGVLTYNMLKKKKGGNVTQMPMRKAAYDPAHDNVDLEGHSPAAPAPRKSVTVPKEPGKVGKGVKAAVPAAIAAIIGGGTGAALGSSLASPASPMDASKGKTWAGKNLGVSSGSDVGDAAIGAGAVGLGVLGLHQLYKKIRGGDSDE